MQNNEQSHRDPKTSLVSQAEAELAKGKEHRAKRMWDHAARQFRSAADLYHRAGEHTKEGDALEKAARAFEKLQSWRIAAEMWEETARALGGHTVQPPSPREPKTRIGEAYLWAGNTYFWSDQHYESFYAHVLAGQAFEAAEDWPRAERAYCSGAISRARSVGSLDRFDRDAHEIYKKIAKVKLIKAINRVARKRQEDKSEDRESAARSHFDSLFSIRRALEIAGNQEEARKIYKKEMDARYKCAKNHGPLRQRWKLFFFKWVLGYGEGWFNLLIISTLLYVLLFPLLYTIFPDVEGAKNIWDRIYFSLVTATTLGYGDMKPLGWARLLANIESIFGLVTFGLLLAVLVRRVSR